MPCLPSTSKKQCKRAPRSLDSFKSFFSSKPHPRLLVYEIVFDKLKKPLWAGIILISICGTLSAQDNKIDSLKTLVESTTGLDSYDPLINLAIAYANVDYNLSLETTIRANNVATQFGDSARMVKASRIIGQLLNRLDRSKEAIKILSETYPIAERNNYRDDKKTILNNLALAYTVQADYEKALDLNFQTLLLREQDNDKHEMGISLNNIGFVYFKLKNYNKALEFYNQSLAIKTEAKDSYDLDRLYINIGLCHNQLKNFKEAEEAFRKGFQVCNKDCANQTIIEGEFGLGVASYFQRNFEKAKNHLNRSRKLANENGNHRFEAENLIYLGHIYVDEKNYDSARLVLSMCETVALAEGYNELLLETYKEFYNVYQDSEDFEKASVYQSRYITLKDSIMSEDLIDRIAKIQTNFAERENLKVIADKDEVIERQRSLNFAIVIIALLAALLIFVLFRANRVRKKVNLALSDAKAIIEDQNRQLLSSNYNLDRELKEKNTELQKANESLLRVNDELDNFIYKTSHDIRGPLASLKGMCNVALMDVKDPLALNYLKKLDITAEKLNTILTRLLIVNQINNSALGQDRIDFDTIINDVLLLEKKKGLPSRLKIKKSIDPLIEYYSDKEFVRIIFENLIDNAIKFYNDSQRVEPFVEILVTQEDNHVRIRVIDNGIGISEVHPDKIFQMFSRASERSETGGIGLYITKTATEKLGGSVNLKTSPEGYTEFYVLLPLATSKVMV
jgi:signal transduction histidine kinase